MIVRTQKYLQILLPSRTWVWHPKLKRIHQKLRPLPMEWEVFTFTPVKAGWIIWIEKWMRPNKHEWYTALSVLKHLFLLLFFLEIHTKAHSIMEKLRLEVRSAFAVMCLVISMATYRKLKRLLCKSIVFRVCSSIEKALTVKKTLTNRIKTSVKT